MPNTIILKGDFRRKEGTAGAGVTPGELLLRSGASQYTANGTAGDADAQRIFALENDLVGDDIDDDYDSGDTVQAAYPVAGTEVYAWLEYGADVDAGDALESGGSGNLQAHSSGRIVAYALEDKTNTSGGARVRIKVEVA